MVVSLGISTAAASPTVEQTVDFRRARVESTSQGSTFSDAVQFSPQRSATNETSRALRSLSDSASLISITEAALEDTERTLNQLGSITNELGQAVNAERRSALEAEADELLSELDRIEQETTFKGEQVFNQDPRRVSANLDGSRDNSTAVVDVTVASIPAGSAQLGLSKLNGSAISEDSDSAQTEIAEASKEVRTGLSRLEDSRAQLSEELQKVARNAGLTSESEIAERERGAEDEVNVIIERLAGNLQLFNPTNIAADRIQAILRPDSNDASSSEPSNSNPLKEFSVSA